jgi:hypothetical protein
LTKSWLCRSVSYATPAYYAHLAADKCRIFLQLLEGDDMSTPSRGYRTATHGRIQLHGNINDTMYFA